MGSIEGVGSKEVTPEAAPPPGTERSTSSATQQDSTVSSSGAGARQSAVRDAFDAPPSPSDLGTPDSSIIWQFTDFGGATGREQMAPSGPPRGDGSFSSRVAGTEPQRELDLRLAQMANDSYSLPGTDGKTGTDSEDELEDAGWRRLRPEGDHLVDHGGNEIAINPAMLGDPKSGFRAAIYHNGDGHYVVAYAGTNPSEPGDVVTDAAQALGMETRQYEMAVKLAMRAERVFGDGNVAFTGHSLGGGLAATAAMAADAAAVTFNAAGVSNDTLRDLNLNPNARRDEVAASGQVRRYVVQTDPLTLAQEGIPAIPVPFVGSISPPNALGHELHVALPEGMTPLTESHGGGDDGTSYVEALRAGDAYRPLDLSSTPVGLGMVETFAELNFNQFGSRVEAMHGAVLDAFDAGRSTELEIRGVIATDFADGDYLKGSARILGDGADGVFDLAGDVASRGATLASEEVENAAQASGRLLRNGGGFTGLKAPADFVAGTVETAGRTIGNLANTSGDRLNALGDRVGDGTEWLLDRAGEGAERFGEAVAEAGRNVVEGARSVAEKLDPRNWF